MRNNPVWLLLVVAIAPNANASEPALSGISVGELGKVQSETILYKAKAELAKAQRDVPEGISTATTQTVTSGVGNTLPPPMSLQPMDTGNALDQSGLPVIKAVTGSPRKLQATLLYSGGMEIDATTGRDLPHGFRVTQVTLDGVVLERKGMHFSLGFSNQVPSVSAPQVPFRPQPASATPGMLPLRP